MKIVMPIVCVFFILAANAQSNINSEKLHITSINQVGLLVGEGGSSTLLQTINGISKKREFVGLGTGIDFYGPRSIPLFIDYRHEFLKSANKAFLYADGGVHFQWLNFIENESRSFPKASPGLYYEAGIGYNVVIRRHTGFVISAGYAYKRINETFTTYRAWGVTGQSAETKDRRISEYRRWAVKFGIRI